MSSPHHFHVIKDPVHGVMQFSAQENNWIKPFINHPHFQRLRHIRQVGMADLIFPGAVYTRFNHSLGCCYVSSKIAHKIGLSDAERQLVLLACLLHDIGHGPFSHAFEDLFLQRYVRHEAWTPYYLQDFSTPEFLSAYRTLNPDAPLTAEKMADIEAMIMHRYTKNTLLSDIVSSQLDADRLDYLLRDSHFCGVKYGEFDLRWMLHCLMPVKTENGWHLGVAYKGIGVVEHYLVARWLMIRNIYHNEKKQTAERLLTKFLRALAHSIPHEKFLARYRKTALGRFLMRVNHFNQEFQHKQPSPSSLHNFLKKNFSLYQQLCDYHVHILISELAQLDSPHDVSQLAHRIYYRQLPKAVALTAAQVTIVQDQVNAIKQQPSAEIRDWQLEIISVPRRGYSGDSDPIWVQETSGRVSPLHENSPLIHALSYQDEHAYLLFIDYAIVAREDIKFLLESIVECR